MRLKTPSQPLVFCFSGVTPLCGAVAKLYDIYPDVTASLCLYRHQYYIAVYSKLTMRRHVWSAAIEFGVYLGPGSVMYSFFEEHGKKISHNAITELGAALHAD